MYQFDCINPEFLDVWQCIMCHVDDLCSYNSLALTCKTFYKLINSAVVSREICYNIFGVSCPALVSPKAFYDLYVLLNEPCANIDNLRVFYGKIEEIYSLRLNGLKAELPKSLSALKNVTNIVINNTYISYIPDIFYSMPSVEKIRLYNNPALSKMPTSVNTLKLLSHVDIKNCGFEGIPIDFSNHPCLDEIYFEDQVIYRANWAFTGDDNNRQLSLMGKTAPVLYFNKYSPANMGDERTRVWRLSPFRQN